MKFSLPRGGPAAKICAIAIFCAAALIQVFFKDVPWPLHIEDNAALRTASANLATQEIVISNATVAPHHSFLAYQGNAFETVDLDFDRAQLGDDTAALLAAFPPAPPAVPAAWHFVSHDDASAPQAHSDRDETCRTFLDVSVLGNASAANEFHFLQLGSPGLTRLRHLEIRTDAAPLAVNVKTEWPADQENKALGCHKRLQSGDWFRGIVNHPVAIVASPHSAIRIDFVSLSSHRPSWGGPDKPFNFAEMGPLSARELFVRPIADDGAPATGPPALHLTGYRDSRLNVKDLEINSDTVQVSSSGTAWAAVNGHRVGLDLWDTMQKNVMFAALLTSANALLLAWLRTLFFGKSTKLALSDAKGDA